MESWCEVAVAWLSLSAVGGSIVGIAGTVIGGPGAGAVLAAITAGLALTYALDAALVARRSDPERPVADGTPGGTDRHRSD